MPLVPKFLCLNAKCWNKLDPNGLPALEVSRMLSFCLFCCNTTSYGMAYWNLIFIYFCSIEKEAFSVLFIIISKYDKWSLHDEGNRSASLFQLCIINILFDRVLCGVAHTCQLDNIKYLNFKFRFYNYFTIDQNWILTCCFKSLTKI